MNELITIHSDNGKRTVSARDLHKFLDVRMDFSNWIKTRIVKYDFVEGHDYFTLNKKSERQILKEYYISTDAAKEISMLQNNIKGREARRYFIEAERALRELPAVSLPMNYLEALKALVSTDEMNICLKAENDSINKTLEVIKPAAEYGQKILNTTTLFTSTNIGQELGLSAVRLNKILRAQLNIIRRGTGDTDYEVKAKYLNEGFVDHITTPYKNTLGENKLKRSLRWTRKGFDWLCDNKDSILDPSKKSLKIISKPILYKGL